MKWMALILIAVVVCALSPERGFSGAADRVSSPLDGVEIELHIRIPSGDGSRRCVVILETTEEPRAQLLDTESCRNGEGRAAASPTMTGHLRRVWAVAKAARCVAIAAVEHALGVRIPIPGIR